MQVFKSFRRVLVATTNLLMFLGLLSGCDIESRPCFNIVANADKDCYFRVDNDTGGSVRWYLPDFAFGATVGPGECTRFGIDRHVPYDFEVIRVSDGYKAAGTITANATETNVTIVVSRLYFLPPDDPYFDL